MTAAQPSWGQSLTAPIGGGSSGRRTRIIVWLIVLVVVVLVLAAAGYYLRGGKIGPLPLPQLPTALREEKIPVELKTEYNNPFERDTQYVNPFQKFKSPFQNLQQ